METNVTLASNMSALSGLPPLPSYTVKPLPPLLSYISDLWLSLMLPIVGYWALSLFFHYVDIYDVWPQYRLHTPAEISSRNRASRYEVLRDVIIQQIIQTIVGGLIGMTEAADMTGKEEYDIARWATRLRIAQRALPQLLAFVGLNAAAISKNVAPAHPMIAGILAGGKYPSLSTTLDETTGTPVPTFAAWELLVANAMYWYVVPAAQLWLAVMVVDTWEYFLHRAMHMNKWLYTTIHSRHHRLYVPYAYGALYNHPLEGFLLDTLGAGVGAKIACMTVRQQIFFYTFSTLKTVDDHCGYALPWDPLQHITSNNAGYHDIHHQSWGIKTNFSQPFFTFWDRFLGTMWTGDSSAKYERSRQTAEAKANAKKNAL